MTDFETLPSDTIGHIDRQIRRAARITGRRVRRHGSQGYARRVWHRQPEIYEQLRSLYFVDDGSSESAEQMTTEARQAFTIGFSVGIGFASVLADTKQRHREMQKGAIGALQRNFTMGEDGLWIQSVGSFFNRVIENGTDIATVLSEKYDSDVTILRGDLSDTCYSSDTRTLYTASVGLAAISGINATVSDELRRYNRARDGLTGYILPSRARRELTEWAEKLEAGFTITPEMFGRDSLGTDGV